MPSVLSNPVRVAPQQKRSERRLAAFLDAAAALFVEVGYEAATMTAIAERSASSIGALYNYFPDKQAIALTLVNQYGQELEAYWKPLIEQAAKLTHRQFADLFIERITELVRQRPAYLSLATAPVRFRRPPAAKKALWSAVGNAFRAKNPSLSEEQSVLAAKVTLQMVSGLMMLYAEAAPKAKDLVVDEFKKVLTLYLGTIAYEEETRTKQD
jgi:AcrR family transcriptional regulator